MIIISPAGGQKYDLCVYIGLKIVFACKTYSATSVSKTHLKHAWALRPTAEGRRGPEAGPLGPRPEKPRDPEAVGRLGRALSPTA